jgi:hypothetical protein
MPVAICDAGEGDMPAILAFAVSDHHRVTFPCPLCRQAGCVVALEAELELEPEPPLMIVTDLHGGCAHATAFGSLEGQTLEEAWALMEAALDASERV